MLLIKIKEIQKQGFRSTIKKLCKIIMWMIFLRIIYYSIFYGLQYVFDINIIETIRDSFIYIYDFFFGYYAINYIVPPSSSKRIAISSLLNEEESIEERSSKRVKAGEMSSNSTNIPIAESSNNPSQSSKEVIPKSIFDKKFDTRNDLPLWVKEIEFCANQNRHRHIGITEGNPVFSKPNWIHGELSVNNIKVIRKPTVRIINFKEDDYVTLVVSSGRDPVGNVYYINDRINGINKDNYENKIIERWSQFTQSDKPGFVTKTLLIEKSSFTNHSFHNFKVTPEATPWKG